MKYTPLLVLSFLVAGIFGFSADFSYAQTYTLPPNMFPTINIPVLPNASSTGSANAKLIGEIFNKEEVPHWWNSQGTPFMSALYLDDGYFAVSGTCSPPVRPPEKVSGRGVGNNIGIQGGLLVFKEDGTFVDRRNVCYDGGLPNSQVRANELYCNEGAACETSMVMIPTGGSSFIRELYAPHNVYGMNRPPIQYRVSDERISLLAKPYTVRRAHDSDEDTPVIGNLVKVGDRILGIKQYFDEDGGYGGYANVLYTPSFGLIREWDVPTPRPPGNLSGQRPETQSEVFPYAAIGEYLIGLDQRVWADNKASVFKVDDDGELDKVGTLPYASPNWIVPVYDSANRNRVSFLVNPSQGVVRVETYEPDTNGIKMVRSYPLPGLNGFDGGYGLPSFAVAGEYTAYRLCTRVGGQMPLVGNTASPYEGCKVRVLKGDTLFAEIELPRSRGGIFFDDTTQELLADRAAALAMSPNGNLVVGTIWGHLYLYKIGVGVGGTPPGGPILPPLTPLQGGGMQFQGVTDYLNFAQNYLKLSGLLLNPDVQIDPDEFVTQIPATTSTTTNNTSSNDLFRLLFEFLNTL